MNWQAFEDKMREDSLRQEIPVDSDVLWNKIQQKKKRRVVPFIWWIAGTIMLCSVTAVLYQYVIPSADGTLVVDSSVLQTPGTSTTKKDPKNTTVASPDTAAQLKADNPDSATSFVLSEIMNYGAAQPKVKNAIPSASILFVENTIHAAPQLEINNSRTLSKSVFSQIANINECSSNDIKTSIDAVTNNAAPVESANTSHQNRTLSPAVYEDPALLPHAEPALISRKADPEFTYYFKQKKKKSKPKHWIDIGVDGGYYGWTLNRTREDAHLPRSSEKNLESYHVGIQVKAKIAGNWVLSTGAQYNRLNSIYRWREEWDSITNRLYTYEYSNGSIDSLFSSETSIYHFTHTVKNYNKITAWSIPVDLQYTFKAGKWTISPYAGLQAQFYQRSRGVISNKTEVPDEKPYALIYTKPFILSLRTGVRCEIPVAQFTRISITPAAVIDLTGRVKNTLYAPEFFRQYGVNVGVVRRIIDDSAPYKVWK